MGEPELKTCPEASPCSEGHHPTVVQLLLRTFCQRLPSPYRLGASSSLISCLMPVPNGRRSLSVRRLCGSCRCRWLAHDAETALRSFSTHLPPCCARSPPHGGRADLPVLTEERGVTDANTKGCE